MEMIQKEKVKLMAKVVSQEALTDDICSMWIQADAIAKAAKPGQFISVYTKDKSKVLPRPISLCEVDKEQGRLRIVYRVVGAGTREFSAYQAGDDIEIMGPLGNGFPLKEKKAFLIGGGIGIPPMLELAKNLNCEKQMVLGYRDALFLNDEFEQCRNKGQCHRRHQSKRPGGRCHLCLRTNPDAACVKGLRGRAWH